jgi:hypothetical protein
MKLRPKDKQKTLLIRVITKALFNSEMMSTKKKKPLICLCSNGFSKIFTSPGQA